MTAYEVFAQELQGDPLHRFLSSHPLIELTEKPSQWSLLRDDTGQLCLAHREVTSRKPFCLDFMSASTLHKMRSLQQSKQPLIRALG
ncbi:MAG: hypothetical protein AAF202_05630, partial [Pseudomonadota bacterium]